ncbi:uncharacterized protein LOC123916351 isoform X2 [Trifolium pratense]|uniref:uncharacterized protein LOC123916351 isoform X2 n=1 Tax=Trifolium pratense TaxID=57577 RepID=UPI001E692260|nr:uncharacterized protein LOC123916351 isoform X2 [Trifolium pratense]
MAGFMCDLVKPYVEKLVDKAIGEARYVFCYTCIVKEFEDERDTLEPSKTALEERVQVAKRKDKDIKAKVDIWQKNVDKLFKLDTKNKQTCFFKFCPNCIWRYKEGKKLVKNLELIKQLKEEEENRLVNIELPCRLPGVEQHSSENYISFKSRELKYKEILDALKDDNNYIIGLQGMGGTGKTTLAMEVGKELKQSKQFSLVIDTTVSFTPNVKKIQDEIAGPLGLKWEKCTESDRSTKLWSRLTQGEKILLIMDDVWEQKPPFDFDPIGIPKRDNRKGCTVLVTSRSKQVLIQMKCDKIIELDLLSEEEAWIMFKRCASISSSSANDLIGYGRLIVKECKQLPIAIAITASSLMGKHVDKWKGTLQSFRKIGSMHGVDDDLVGIYKSLQVSYENMMDEKAKGLFLICSLFREDEKIHIEVLTRLCIGAGVFEVDNSSYDEVRNKVSVAKHTLINSCMLFPVDEAHVKMHDLVRDVAQWIANREIQCVNLSDKNQKLLLGKEKNVKYLLCEGKVVDFISCKFDGSKLEILIVDMGGKYGDLTCIEVLDSFFENIVKLRVLYFVGDDYLQSLSLSDSIQRLTNIRSMFFDTVDLGDISILGNLQSLETLDMVKCTISELPSKFTKLGKFKLLKLTDCNIIMKNPFEVIKSCSSLEELYFKNSFNNFCQEITLHELQRYHICTGFDVMNDSLSKYLVLKGGDEDNFSKETFKYCIQTAEGLHLTRINKWRNLMPDIVPINLGMNDLVELILKCDSKLQCLIDTKQIGFQVPNVFSKLVVLKLKEMEDLEELCNGTNTISFGYLFNLKELSLESCGNLRSLFKCSLDLRNLKTVTLKACSTLVSVFDLSTSRSLLMLEDLKISDCEKLENIFTYEERVMDGDNDNNKSCNSMFPNLKVVYIENCPQLEYIFPVLSAAEDLLLLKVIKIHRCDSLKYVFDGDNDNNKSCNSLFPKLQVVNIINCFQLQFIFRLLFAKDLLLLEAIGIQHCPNLEYIFDQPQQDLELPSLKQLLIVSVSHFIGIFPESYHPNMPSSIKGSYDSISKPQTKSNKFSWSHICCHRKNLKSAEIPSVSENQPKDCSISQVLNSNFLGECLSKSISHILSNIKVIDLVMVSNIKSVFTLSIAPKMSLESLTIKKCYELEHIVVDIGDGSDRNELGNVFPKLKMLKVEECEKLEYIFGHNDASDHHHHHQNHNNEVTHLHLPALEKLHLHSLPSLIGMCTKNYHTTLPTLIEVKVIECPKVAIKSIGDFMVTNYSMISISQEISTTIKEFSGNTDPFLALKRLTLNNNSKVENIFCLNEANDQQMNLGLEDIELYDLSMMMCLFVGPKNYFSLKNLTGIEIVRCEKLEIVFSTSISRCLPQLYYLRIEECKELKCIIEDDTENNNLSNVVSSKKCFLNLKVLIVVKCNRLKSLFHVSICNDLPKLKAMMIKEANELQDLFGTDGDQKVEIPNLKLIVFVNLPSLRRTQGIQSQEIRFCFVWNCQNLSPTSTIPTDVDGYDLNRYLGFNSSEYKLIRDLKDIVKLVQEESKQRHQQESKQHNTGSENQSSEATSGDLLTFSQVINVEEGTTSTNADTIALASSGPLVTSECKTSLLVNAYGPIVIYSPPIVTIQPLTTQNVDVGNWHETIFLNDVVMKVSSTIEEQIPNDDEQIVSKSRLSVISSQLPYKGFPYGIEVQATSGHELTFSHENDIDSNINGLETKMKQSAKGKQEYVVNVPRIVEITSIEDSDCLKETEDRSIEEGSTSETRNEPPIQLVADLKQKGTESSFHDFDLGDSQETTRTNNEDVDLYLQMESAYRQFQESKYHDDGNENPNAQTTKEFAEWIEVQATLGHKLTSSQKKMKKAPEAKHTFVEDVPDLEIPSTTLLPTNSEEDGDGKICLPSFSIVNTKPPATKDVDIGDSQETIVEDINKLIEEDPLLALEKLLTGVQSFSIETLLQELKTLMDSTSDLDHLVSNQESKSKLISLLHGLNQHQRLLPSDVKEFVEKVQNFFNDNIKQATSQRVIKKHNLLLDSKTDLMNKLMSAKSTQAHIDSETSTANAKIHELSLQIEDLENQRNALKSVVNKCDVQKMKLKAECTEWAQQSKKFISALASSEVDVREAERARYLAKEGFANLKSSFPTFRKENKRKNNKLQYLLMCVLLVVISFSLNFVSKDMFVIFPQKLRLF